MLRLVDFGRHFRVMNNCSCVPSITSFVVLRFSSRGDTFPVLDNVGSVDRGFPPVIEGCVCTGNLPRGWTSRGICEVDKGHLR
jgi:hypothetical protein